MTQGELPMGCKVMGNGAWETELLKIRKYFEKTLDTTKDNKYLVPIESIDRVKSNYESHAADFRITYINRAGEYSFKSYPTESEMIAALKEWENLNMMYA